MANKQIIFNPQRVLHKIQNKLISEKRYWFRFVFQLHSSVIPGIFPRVIFFTILSLIISTFYHFGIAIVLPAETSIVSSLVLGLLLVFRTNTAYERFWEGRKQWGILINTVRNFAREIWVGIAEENREDKQKKIQMIRLLPAFSIATKLHLRGEPVDRELEELMPREWFEKLKTMNNPPLEIAFWLGDYIKGECDRDRIEISYMLSSLQLLNTMVDVLGGCERILKTPIPLAYSIHLKQLLFIYSFCLPLQLVQQFEWGTAIIVGLICFTIFGIEEIGIEIENPFGHDPNDLPLDAICQTMKTNIDDLISLSPSVRHFQ